MDACTIPRSCYLFATDSGAETAYINHRRGCFEPDGGGLRQVRFLPGLVARAFPGPYFFVCPVCPVVWEGRRRETPPIPIAALAPHAQRIRRARPLRLTHWPTFRRGRYPRAPIRRQNGPPRRSPAHAR